MADENKEIKQEIQAEEIVAPAQDAVEELQVEEQPKVEDVAPVEDTPADDKVEEKEEVVEPEKVEEKTEEVEEPPKEEETKEPEEEKEDTTEEKDEEPEVVEEQVDVEAIKRELEELKAEKEEKAELEALNKENAKVAREFDELCGKLGEALEGELKKFGIPLDKSIEELEAEDKAKADIARRLTQEANDLIERAKQDANKFIADKARDLVFKKADRMLKGYEVSEEEVPIVAETFLDIIDQAGVRDLEDDLRAKLELAVARAKMVCKHVAKAADTVSTIAGKVADKIENVVEKVEKVEEVISDKKDIKPKEEVTEPITEEPPVAEPEKVQEPVVDTSEFEEGVGGAPQPASGISVENVLEKMASLPYKEQTRFYKENMALVEEALKRGVK